MICEAVLVVALALPPKSLVPQAPRRVCLAQLLARAARENALVIDLRLGRGGRVYRPGEWRGVL